MGTRSVSLIGLFLCGLAVGAQTHEWVLPWVANRDGAWASELAINNHSAYTVEVELEAIRPSGERETVRDIALPPWGQWVADAGTTFPSLGSGSGYVVFIRADTETLSAAVKVSSLNTASGDSPSLGAAVLTAQATNRLVFQFMPYSPGAAAAPVIVNVTDQDATVEISAYSATGQAKLASISREIPGRTPFADVMDNLFPQVDEPTYLVVSSDVALVGMAFNFNVLREPSMINAQPSTIIEEEDVYPLIATLETATVLTNSFNISTADLFDLKNADAKRDDCPQSDIDIDRTNAESYINATFDWGSGCVNLFGIYHSGSIHLQMEREGTLQTGGWMNGTLDFDQFNTRFLGSQLSIDGTTHAEGSTRSNNFTLSGSWSASASIPLYWIYGNFDSETLLSVNNKGSHYEVYGHLSVRLSAYYGMSLLGEISQQDPLKYKFANCPWPTSGRIAVTVTYGYTVSGWLDFGTGDCNTAELNISGQSLLLYLPGIYL